MNQLCCYLVAKSCQILLQPHSSSSRDFSGKNIGVDCHFLLQRIFATQGSKPCLLNWQVDCLPLSHQGSPLESALHIHAPLLFQSFFPFRSRLPWWLRWFSSAYNAGDPGSIPGSGRCPGEGNGTPRQYSCLENPMDGGTWRATVHGLAKRQTRLSN